MANEAREECSALVGWTASRIGDRVTLRLQSVDSGPPHTRRDIRSHFYVLDSNQAVQLGNMLFEATNQTKPDPRSRRLFTRLFG